MKDEIKQILEMSRKGVIDDDQAAELLGALRSAGDTPERERPDSRRATIDLEMDFDGIGQAIGERIGDIGAAIKQTLSGLSQPWGEGNQTVLSTVAPAEMDDASRCEGNDINVSTVKGIRLVRGAFCGNSLNAAKLRDVTLTDAQIQECSFNGASMELALERSALRRCELNGCKVSGLQIRDSQITALSANGVKLRGGVVDSSRLQQVTLSGVALDGLRLERAQLTDVTIQGGKGRGKMAGLSMTDVELRDCTFSGCDLTGTRFEGLRLNDVRVEDRDLSGQVITDPAQLVGETR